MNSPSNPVTDDASNNGGAGPQNDQTVRRGPYLWKIIKEAHPNEYGGRIGRGIALGVYGADQALSFPLSQRTEKHLVGLPHRSEHATEYTRDERLTLWFKACLDCGADPLRALARMGEHAAAGFGRLIQMKAFGALEWWKKQGAEHHFAGPHALGQEPTNFATLAFVYGYPSAIPVLLTSEGLTHTDQLWRLMWGHRCADRSSELIKHLWAQGNPPSDALAGLGEARLNKKNISQVLATAQALVDAGCGPTTPAGKMPTLGVVISKMTSPAAAQMVEFLLTRGADPLEKSIVPGNGDKEPDREMSMVEVALEWVMRCASISHLRLAAWSCFARMAKACDRQALLAIYPPSRQGLIIEELRGKQAGWTPYGQRENWSSDREVAALQQLWLELSVGGVLAKPKTSARI
jgi:hypothetical protein